MKDIVTLGEVLIDFSPIGKDKNGYNKYLQNPGGAPLNVACVIGKYGGSASFIGKVGNDIFGRFIKEEIEKLSVDTSGLIVDNNHQTTLAFVSLKENGERGFEFLRKNSADINLDKKDINIDLIKGARIFHFGSVSMTDEPSLLATLYAKDEALKNGCLISCDPNYREMLWEKDKAKKAMGVVLGDVDFLKVSEEEAYILTGVSDIKRCASILKEKVKKIVLITLGEKGVYYKSDLFEGIVNSYKVDVVDTTGAGDIFYGTFLYEYLIDKVDLLNEESITKALKKACKAASLSIMKKGAIPSIPSLNEID